MELQICFNSQSTSAAGCVLLDMGFQGRNLEGVKIWRCIILCIFI